MKTYTKESLIAALCQIRENGWIESARPGNDGAIGNTLEDLLGISENNLPIPNAAEWELKAQRRDTKSLTTLFHMEPSPTACKFVPQLLLPQYGWAHKEAGKKYALDEKSFRQTIHTQKFSDRGFSVALDHKERKINITFDATKIGEHHAKWKDSVKKRIGFNELNPQPYWGFDDLFHKVGTKLHNTFFVRAQRKKEHGKEFFLYEEILMLKSISKEKFINAIEEGEVYVDFDARSGHNHGTKFRINSAIIPKLYAESIEI